MNNYVIALFATCFSTQIFCDILIQHPGEPGGMYAGRVLAAALIAGAGTAKGAQPVSQEQTLKNAHLTKLINTKECEGCDLTQLNLPIDLKNARLKNANLAGADLKSENFNNADLSGANLTGANLKDADLTGANLTGANLKDARCNKKGRFYGRGTRFPDKSGYNCQNERVVKS